jgi:dTDP-4-dehydrorhamnose reductase
VKQVILGASGQLGQDLVPRLGGEVIPLARAQADLTCPGPLRETLAALRPDIVVNCAAYNFVDRAEAEPEAAFAVNAWGVRNLARVCGELHCVLVHYSTDHVFGLDGSRRTPYAPDDPPGPVSVYGLSKLAGEYMVQSLCPRHFVIRTCGLYGIRGSGGKGGNFVETMLRLAGQGKTLRVVHDQVCTPTYTVDLADATAALLASGQCGLHHLTNTGACSWFEFARSIFELTGAEVSLTPITSREYGAAARRPGYSVLAGGGGMRPWREALAAYLAERSVSG